MHIDPVARFWIGVVVTAAIGVGNGTLVLTNAVPHDWIPTVTAWCGIIAFLGSSVLTALNGMGATTASRLASAAAANVDPQATPEVKNAVSAAVRATS